MKVEQFPIDDLIPYEKNNRTHPPEQINRIANSIAEFGFNQPIVIDEGNIILVGHGRYEAAVKLGLNKVPVVKLTKLTKTQKKAYRILDNKLQGDSTWDFGNLELELSDLEEDGFDLSTWGLTDLKRYFGDPVEGNPLDEYKDMPEYISEDDTAVQKIIVHFLSRGDVEDFAELVKQKLTEKTKSIWFPAIATRDLKQTRVEDDES